MAKVPNTKKIEAYGKRTFHTKRLRKKQISVLRKSYARLSKRHNAWVANITTTGDISEREGWLFMISLLRSSAETINKCKNLPVCKPIMSDEDQDKMHRKRIEEIRSDPVEEHKKLTGKTDEDLEQERKEWDKLIPPRTNS